MGTVHVLRPKLAVGYCTCTKHNESVTLFRNPTIEDDRERDAFFVKHCVTGCNIQCKSARWPL